jgi:UDPglucose 6-dehydrogenase
VKFNLPVAYVPENLRLGKGIETFLNADRTVIGADQEELRVYVKDLLKDFKTEFLTCGLETSEMTKHATNAFLATSISFANELARIGEKYRVESQVVAKALKMDKRIGPAAYVAPGLGFAGGTLPRDLRVLQKLGKQNSIPTPLIDSVLRVNQETTTAVAEIVMDRTKDLKRPPEVLVLGYTYKADTDTLRRSLSIEIAAQLKSQGCHIWGFDPMMNSHNLSEIHSLMHHCPQLADCSVKPDVILVMTARPSFKSIDFRQFHKFPLRYSKPFYSKAGIRPRVRL